VVIPQQTPQLQSPASPLKQQQTQQQQQQPTALSSVGGPQPQASWSTQPQLQPQVVPAQQQQQQSLQQPLQQQQVVQPQPIQPQQLVTPVQVPQSAATPVQALPALGSPGFKDNAYVELRSDPTVGGFLQSNANGNWDVWPRMDGKTFTGFLGYGYSRVKASGGKVANDINPAEWELVRFPVAPTGPAAGGEQFWTQGPRSHHADYQGMVGKVLRFTLGGLGSLDCGCNANFYAVRKGAGCDGSGARPTNCEEIDFFEGNKFAWHSTLHALADSGETDSNGLCTGYGGTLPSRPNFPSFSGEEYGPNGTMIDTTKPFSVAASFPKRVDGTLKGMSVELSQQGKPSMQQPLFMHLYEYKGSAFTEFGGGGTNVENGMGKIEQRLNEGVTTLSSMWTAPNGGMRWLDGAASQHGPKNMMDGKCTWDGGCSGYSIRNVVLENLPLEATAATEIELI